jgi:hypothetical protein
MDRVLGGPPAVKLGSTSKLEADDSSYVTGTELFVDGGVAQV